MKAKFFDADQNWQDETTIYWFDLEGTTYGIVEGDDAASSRIVNADGYPLTEGDPEHVRADRAIEMTDEIRRTAAGF